MDHRDAFFALPIGTFLFWPYSENPILRRVVQWFPLFLGCMAQLAFYEERWMDCLPTLLVLLFVIGLDFVFPFIVRRGQG